jgi:hypothetical protein
MPDVERTRWRRRRLRQPPFRTGRVYQSGLVLGSWLGLLVAMAGFALRSGYVIGLGWGLFAVIIVIAFFET